MSWQLAIGTPGQATLWGLNIVVHATLLAATSLLISLLLRRSAAMRYWVLCFGLAIVSVSPATSALIQATGSSWVRISSVPDSRSVASTLNSEIQYLQERANQPNEVDQPVIESIIETQTVRFQNERKVLNVLKGADRDGRSAPVPEQTSSDPPLDWLWVSLRWLSAPLLFIWLAGAVIHMVRMIVAWIRLSRILRAAKPISNERLKIEFDHACSIVGCRRDRRPQLVSSNAVSGPIAAGILYGKVVLPESLILQVEPESLTNVLVHEVAHVVRHDHIVVLLQNIVSAIYWPHPLVRILNRELAKAREEVCDNFVLVTTEAPTYSRTLLSLAQLLQHSCVIPGSVGFFTDRWKLEHRIAGLLDNNRNRSTILKKRNWLLLLATFTLVVWLTCVGTITTATSQTIQDRAYAEEVGQETTDLNSIELQVTDMDDKAISGAQASALLWDGTWNELPISDETDEAGKATLSSLPTNKYMAVIVKAAGFAPTCSASELGKQEKRTLHLKLSKPVTSKIQVRDDKGRPVRGAMLSLLVVNDKGGGSLATRFGSKTPYGTTLPMSDDDGNIVLNDLPIGASVSVTVLHPDWVQTKVQDMIASEGQIGSAYLKSGDTMQVNLIRDETVPALSATELFNLNAMPNEADRKTIPSVYHLFPAIDDQIHATVERLDHHAIRLQAKNDEIIVTPYIDQSDERFTEILSRPVDGKRSIDFLVRRARSFQCKLVGDLSLLNDKSYVSGSTENKGPNAPVKIGSRNEFISCSIVEPSKDGRFTLKLPNGRACIDIQVPGAKVTPSRFEFMVEPDKEPIIPEFRIEKMEKLRGRTVDAKGNPVPNAVVRFYHGMWGTDYQRSNDQGEFQLDTEGQLFAKEKPPELSICRVMAFEPKGTRAGMVEINPKTFDDHSTMTVVMEDRSPTWVVDQIQQLLDRWQTEEMRKLLERLAGEIQAQKKAFAAGDYGQVPPNLSEGEWLQSECKSLDEMRGKFVLLDFWFIGCGPCAADMPSLKLVRELFGGADFEIVGVHSKTASAESVRQYIQQNGVKYPTIIDTPEETISRRFRELGVTGFPSYILLDREGKILHNDNLTMSPSLRDFKVEVIYSALRSARE